MAPHQKVEDLIEAAKQLPPEERKRLVQALSGKTPEPMHHITELRGLGKEIWQGQDAQEYINAERDSWDD